ncbi:MAG: class II aldolase/adducin family protein, partial [Gammaproteobacteria bacterium]
MNQPNTGEQTIPLPHCSEDEWQIRKQLAAAYRLVHNRGWTSLIFTHITARVPGVEDHFLINNFG